MGNAGSDLSSECASIASDYHDEEEGRLGYGQEQRRPVLSSSPSVKALSHGKRNSTTFKEYIFDTTIDDLEKTVSERHLDHAIDSIVPMAIGESTTKVIRPYHPAKLWLWRQWNGTIWQHGYKNVALMMIYTFAVLYTFPYIEENILGESLGSLSQLFKYLLTLSVFILTFFLNQSYGLWRDIYNNCRSLQGTADDLSLLAATHATRVDGKYTVEAEATMNDIAMAIRIFHIFVYASKTRRFRVLHTNRALKRMVQRDVISTEMCDAIIESKIFNGDRVFAIIEWIMIKFQVGLDDGSLRDASDHFQSHVLQTGLLLRKHFGGFRGILEARIPLAYVHFVQVMVDTLLFIAPLALYKDLGMFAIPTVAIMTAFFGGLLDLSKEMLDPFDNEDYCDGVIDINCGVFIRQANYGAVKFKDGAEILPEGWINTEKKAVEEP
mmetsp:Transcript_16394/g.23127  ORF Transcript_16394/g.23127 Transcript_16394/m.23127 type:complete len:438 (+) Transcript_16394:105-1418(+)